jgi:hypothetical protein
MGSEAFAREHGGGFFAGQLVACAQQDGCAGAADLPSDFQADALVRSGDQCNLSRFVGQPLFSCKDFA